MKIGTAIAVVGVAASVTTVMIFAPVVVIKVVAVLGFAVVVGFVLVNI